LLAAVIAALAAAMLAATALGSVRKGATYKGTTSEPNGTVGFKVSANGKKVLNFTTLIGYDDKCEFKGGVGGAPTYELRVSSMSIRSNGSFAGSATGKVGPFHQSFKIAGRIKGKKASGTVENPTNLCGTDSPHPTTKAYFEMFTARAK
jgi:hypothetical protein